MKILRYILFGLIGLIALVLLVAAFLPKDFKAESSIVINKPKQEVFDYMRHIKNMDNYGVWNLSDPNMKKGYEGTDGTVGFKYSWDGKKAGKGTQTIKKIEDGRIETELDFGFGDPAISHMIIEEVSPDQTKVTWGISGRSSWPMNLMSAIYDMNPMFQEGLGNLKNVLEK
jgi:hypothetical protein